MMEEEKMEGMEEEEIDEVKQNLENGGFMCCCCLCQCTEAKIKDLSCCCFFPIRCGVLFIGCFILAITLFVFLEIFYELAFPPKETKPMDLSPEGEEEQKDLTPEAEA